MKKNRFIVTISLFTLLLSQLESKAQLKLIHYWDFNATQPCAGTGGTNLSPIAADYTKLGHAYLVLNQTLTPQRDSIIDNGTGGSSINVRSVLGNDTTTCGANLYVRTRNPSSENQFLWFLPTTNYKNIMITYVATRSGSGPLGQLYSYSLDSGLTFTTAGLGTTGLPDSSTINAAWTQIQLDFSSIAAVNNNPKFVLRIKTSQQNITLNGNDRYDNVTVEGDSLNSVGISEINGNNFGYNLFPNPAKDNLFISSSYEGNKIIAIYNIIGEAVYATVQNKKEILLNTSQLENGVYFVVIKEQSGRNPVTLKFIKAN
ncbi:MAG TPA: T9SS type A sorting domain-containing protein [Bacteroidia bacterium]|jgi:hypothetical protein|nr:T9SS type A sorting domain-containing protein [Bacteroidia bacterium]